MKRFERHHETDLVEQRLAAGKRMHFAVKSPAVLGVDESGPLPLPGVGEDLIHRRDVVTPHVVAGFVPVKHEQLYRERTRQYHR